MLNNELLLVFSYLVGASRWWNTLDTERGVGVHDDIPIQQARGFLGH